MSTPETPRTVYIARCPEHGLHGERTECFVCKGPVERVPMVPKALVDVERERLLDLLRRWAGYETPGDVRVETARLLREHGPLGKEES